MLVAGGIAPDLATGLRTHLAVAIDAGRRSTQTASGGPTPQTYHRFGGRDSHRHDVMSRLRQRYIQQGRKAATRANLGPSPVRVIGPSLTLRNTEQLPVHRPDDVFLLTLRQIDKERGIKAFGPHELRRQSGNIVRGANKKDIRVMIRQPGKQVAKESSSHAAIAL